MFNKVSFLFLLAFSSPKKKKEAHLRVTGAPRKIHSRVRKSTRIKKDTHTHSLLHMNCIPTRLRMIIIPRLETLGKKKTLIVDDERVLLSRGSVARENRGPIDHRHATRFNNRVDERSMRYFLSYSENTRSDNIALVTFNDETQLSSKYPALKSDFIDFIYLLYIYTHGKQAFQMVLILIFFS